MPTRKSKNIADMCIRLDTIAQRDGRTDRRMNGNGKSRSRSQHADAR